MLLGVPHRPQQDLAAGRWSAGGRPLAVELGRIESIQRRAEALRDILQPRVDPSGIAGHREFVRPDPVDLLSGEQVEDVRLGRAERVRRQHQQAVRVLGRRPPVELRFGQTVERLDDVTKQPQQIVAVLGDLAIRDAPDDRCAPVAGKSR
jgi:hypothetical protein